MPTPLDYACKGAGGWGGRVHLHVVIVRGLHPAAVPHEAKAAKAPLPVVAARGQGLGQRELHPVMRGERRVLAQLGGHVDEHHVAIDIKHLVALPAVWVAFAVSGTAILGEHNWRS